MKKISVLLALGWQVFTVQAQTTDVKQTIKPGTIMVWEVNFNEKIYDFTVTVKSLRPSLVVFWEMSGGQNKGMMTITEKALRSAEWQKNYFGIGDDDILLEDATSIWVSDAVFASLKAGKPTAMAGDNQINDITLKGVQYLPAKVKGKNEQLEVIFAESEDHSESYYILNDPDMPIIMKMKFGWQLTIKEIK